MIVAKLVSKKYKNLIIQEQYKKKFNKKLLTPNTAYYLQKNTVIKVNYNKNLMYSYPTKLQTLITYIVSIHITKKNIRFNVKTPKGLILINVSSGSLGFKGSQKNKKISLLSMLKLINYNYNFLNNQPVLLQLKGFKYYNKLIIKKLKNKFEIKLLYIKKSNPHNGCRPRKIKRR